ncbi:MAG: hypothetical protein QM765_30895 [Myxococcales bacterium]
MVLSLFPLALLLAVFVDLANGRPIGIWAWVTTAVPLFLLAAWFLYESHYRFTMGDVGIEVRSFGLLGTRTVGVAFDDIVEIRLSAKQVLDGSTGGDLLGVVTSAVDAAARTTLGDLNEDTVAIRVKVRSRDGKSLVLSDSIRGVLGVYLTLCARTGPRLLKAARESLQTEGRCQFGPFAVTRFSILFGRTEIPFLEIESLALEGGLIRLHRRGKWLDTAKVPCVEVPNLHVLVALLEAAKRGEASKVA